MTALTTNATCRLAILVIGGFAAASPLAQTKTVDAPIHDPTSPAYTQLQQPREVTTWFPRDREQRPDWVDVLRRGLIEPRETLRGQPRPPETMGEMPPQGVLYTNTQQMPYVVFPHAPHAEWLACPNCHDALFGRQATGRGQGMQAILEGRHCGACHGRVAFSPEGSCYRCHSQPNPTGIIQNPGEAPPATTAEAGKPTKRRQLGDPPDLPRAPVFPAR